ncbi:gas vesicle protein GvpL [Natrononativus amylolyticus]|uniref:gas vesicle protein GvpL n=1 Tax=Natrononativus amylolyticus TaxID=2963434 RepID=UPI0020CDF21E|nr:GvpL/GvpF family gas vesicle protein [Natrononativus amylolyticus]
MSREPATSEGADAGGTPEIDEGRYIYCVVQAPADDAVLETDGIDDEPVYTVAVDDVAAVVHECDAVYDSADLTEIRRWLVRHQTVVDAAGEAFGTPLPFQFDTILRGDDEAVRDWLREEYDAVAGALESLAGHWEYRVEVVRVEPIDEETLLERDDRLAELRERIDDSTEGTAFLLEKQYDRRLAELREAGRQELIGDLDERLAVHAREVHELERSPAQTLGEQESERDGETLCRLTLLAAEREESAVGAVLDDVAAEPGVEVRFTGPWPPYTFAPAFGDSGEDSSEGAAARGGER